MALNDPTRVLKTRVRYETNKELDADLKGVVREIIGGDWRAVPSEQVQVIQVSGGITNLLYRLQAEEGRLNVLVRIYGRNTEVIIDRDRENRIFAELSSLEFAPTFYGRFTNGRIEGYLPARALLPAEMGQTAPLDFVAFIARELARMHGLDVRAQGLDRSAPLLWGYLDRWLQIAQGITFEGEPDRQKAKAALGLDRVGAEIAWLRSQLLPTQDFSTSGDLSQNGSSSGASSATRLRAQRFLSESVFGHNDLLSGNVLYGEGWKRVQLIDFEYSGYNYRGFDIANHFCEHAGFDSNYEKNYPQEATQLHFLREYLHANAGSGSSGSSGSSSDSPSQENGRIDSEEEEDKEDKETELAFLRSLRTEVNRWALTSHLFWGIWAVIQAKHSPIDFDFLAYSELRFAGYALHKELFFS